MTAGQPLTVWITGASSGIGKAVLERLVAEGHRVIATARSAEALRALADRHPGQVIPLQGDTRCRVDMGRIAAVLRDYDLNWAILNAGTCEYLTVSEFSADLVERVVQTNIVGTARSVEAVLPALRQCRADGGPVRLAVVGSSAAWFPFTRAEAYGASKAALTYFAHSLRADLAVEGIPVTVISPGFVKTPLTDRNDFPMPFLVSVEDAADRIVAGLRRGRSEIQFPKRFTLSLKLLRLLPQRAIDRLAANLARGGNEKQQRP